MIDLTVGSGNRQKTVRVQFMVVELDDPSYNGLIGRGTLNALQEIVSPVHLMMKFPTSGALER